MNVLWSIIWLLLLLFIVWWLADFVAWIYILLLPFAACIPALEPLNDILLVVVQFPGTLGRWIRDGKEGFDAADADTRESSR